MKTLLTTILFVVLVGCNSKHYDWSKSEYNGYYQKFFTDSFPKIYENTNFYICKITSNQYDVFYNGTYIWPIEFYHKLGATGAEGNLLFIDSAHYNLQRIKNYFKTHK